MVICPNCDQEDCNPYEEPKCGVIKNRNPKRYKCKRCGVIFDPYETKKYSSYYRFHNFYRDYDY